MNNTVFNRIKRIKVDLGYIIINSFVNRIPAWWIRRLLYKALGMKIGKHSRIGIGTIVIWPKRIEIGERAIINEYCFLDGRGMLKIGDNVSISIYSKLITASHRLNDDNFEYQFHPIVINDYSFIGAGAIILEGTYLDRGCCIGAGAVAKGSYDKDCIYFGNPATKILKRESQYAYSLYQDYFFR